VLEGRKKTYSLLRVGLEGGTGLVGEGLSSLMVLGQRKAMLSEG